MSVLCCKKTVTNTEGIIRNGKGLDEQKIQCPKEKEVKNITDKTKHRGSAPEG